MSTAVVVGGVGAEAGAEVGLGKCIQLLPVRDVVNQSLPTAVAGG